MPLPDSWVDRIFEKLAVTYGQRFLGLYSGVDLATVKANWAHELAGYADAPEALRHALEHLPATDPPTVLQFRLLCRNRPLPAPPALPHPDPDPEKVAKALVALKRMGGRNPTAWAEELRDREQRSGGAGMTEYQRKAWREVLGDNQGSKEAA